MLKHVDTVSTALSIGYDDSTSKIDLKGIYFCITTYGNYCRDKNVFKEGGLGRVVIDFCNTLSQDDKDEILILVRDVFGYFRQVSTPEGLRSALKSIGIAVNNTFVKINLKDKLLDFVLYSGKIKIDVDETVGKRAQDTDDKTFGSEYYPAAYAICIFTKLVFPFCGHAVKLLQDVSPRQKIDQDVYPFVIMDKYLKENFTDFYEKMLRYHEVNITDSRISAFSSFKGIIPEGQIVRKHANTYVKTLTNFNPYLADKNPFARIHGNLTQGVDTVSCQPGYAPLLTPEGISNFDNIKIGDTIWSDEGWTTVVKKWETGIKPVYKFITDFGVIDATKTHRCLSNGVEIELGETKYVDLANNSLPGGIASARINKVEYVDDLPVYKIMVDNASHTYWSGGFVLKNCTDSGSDDLYYQEARSANSTDELGGNKSDLENALTIIKEPTLIRPLMRSAMDAFVRNWLAKNEIDEERFDRIIHHYLVNPFPPNDVNEALVGMFVAPELGSSWSIRFADSRLFMSLVACLQLYLDSYGFRNMVPLISSKLTNIDKMDKSLTRFLTLSTHAKIEKNNVLSKLSHLTDFFQYNDCGMERYFISGGFFDNIETAIIGSEFVTSVPVDVGNYDDMINEVGHIKFNQDVLNEFYGVIYGFMVDDDRRLKHILLRDTQNASE